MQRAIYCFSSIRAFFATDLSPHQTTDNQKIHPTTA